MNKAYNNDLKVSFHSSDVLTISNVLPLSDVLGKEMTEKEVKNGVQQILDFEIENTLNKDVSFEILLNPQTTMNESIKENYIKFYLTDFDDVPFKKFAGSEIPTFHDLKTLVKRPKSRILYSGNIYAKSKNNYRLRMWLSDSYTISNQLEDFSVSVEVHQKGNSYGK